jgi:hypothetical protein
MRYTYSLTDLTYTCAPVEYHEWYERQPKGGDFHTYVEWLKQDGYTVRETDHYANGIEVLSICIEDWCGSWEHPSYWADWNGTRVTFGGGAWTGIPDMPTPDGTVNETQVWAWVEQHLKKEADGQDDTSNTQDISASGAQGTAVTSGPADQHLL